MSQRIRVIEEKRRRTHRILIGVILATLPCYFCGIVLLVTFSGQEPPPPAPTATSTATLTETPTEEPTITPTITPGGPTLTLQATPTQFSPPTRTLTPTTTLTPTITLTPDANATATVNAILTMAANGLTATAMAPTLQAQATMTAQAGAPVAQNDTANATSGSPVVINVLNNDSDPQGDTLSIVGYDATSAQGGTVSCAASCTYTSAGGFTGTDTFTYTISDGANTDTATVTVTVSANAAPTATDDTSSTQQNTQVVINVLSNDSDPNGHTLTISDYDATSQFGGTVNCSSGTNCTYTPATGFFGSDTFTYEVSDGFGGTDTANVTITVNGKPDAVGDGANAAKNAATPVDINVLANDGDPEGDPITISAYDAASTQGGVVDCSSGTSCLYTPPNGYTGLDTFTYTISDGRGGTDTATVTVTIS